MIKAINDVKADPRALELISELKATKRLRCISCREIQRKTQYNPTTKSGQCYLKLKQLIKGASCKICGCDDALDFDHRDESTKMRLNGKPVQLAHWVTWARLGGPEAMEREAKLCDVLCKNCHFMQPTFNLFKQASTHRSTGNRIEKMKYVDAKKLEIGGCAVCQMQVVPRGDDWWPAHTGWPHVFQFAHRSETEKEHCVSVLANTLTTLKTAKPLIDAEIAKCRLLCACCHRVETNARNSAPGPSEEGN